MKDMDAEYLRLIGLETQTPKDQTTALVHIRAIGMRLSDLALQNAEERWPGFLEMTERLADKEMQLMLKVVDA